MSHFKLSLEISKKYIGSKKIQFVSVEKNDKKLRKKILWVFFSLIYVITVLIVRTVTSVYLRRIKVLIKKPKYI
jgi:hypothetical protein